MANSQADGKRRVRRRRSHTTLGDESPRRQSRGKERVTPEPDPYEVRRIRVERLEDRTSTDRHASTSKMTSESLATLPSQKSSSSHRRRKEHHQRSGEEASREEKSHRRRRRSHTREDSISVSEKHEPKPQRSRITVTEKERPSQEQSSDSEEQRVSAEEDSQKDEPRKKRKIKIIYVKEEDYISSKHKEKERAVRAKRLQDDSREKDDSVRRSKSHHTRRKSEAPPASPLRRSTSNREPPSTSPPSLKRSHTTTSHTTTSKTYAPSISTANTSSKRSSFLGSLFGPVPPPPPREPERLVECLTCLSDDIPRSKSAKLKCGHRMCQSCLKRIFRLSVTDPQHMPPKCCTADHIPLKHVERLFNNEFKKKWNLKFQEYSTRNRIYCPSRRCGEWIKPGNMHKEDGKKYGKCSRCKTKVCCLCNGKWHGSKECPKDEETNKLLETAKQAGWQRCYNCRTMVELKEGCNHMTCHCTAEFCMICGLKWKSCNCPWFNYDAVEADRLQHMRVPEPVADLGPPPPPGAARLQRPRRPRPPTYIEEMDQRRRQERIDENLARRLQTLSMDEDDDYQGGIGDIHGIGNGADHFMNQDYIRVARNILTGNFDQATAAANYVMGVSQARGAPPPGPRRMADRYPVSANPQAARAHSPPPMLRRHSMREQAYNSSPSTRPSERVVPARTRTDYASEAAVHAPVGREPQRSASTRGPRPSVLAGLGGRGNNRVNAWRTHVHPGVTPEEGVLSM